MKETKLKKAKDKIYWVLVDYCENNISSDKREQKSIDRAWETILDNLKSEV